MSTRKTRKAERLKAEQVTGLKYLDQIVPLLERLRDVGCDRDRAGNRELYFDKYCLLVLLNPIVTSMRSLRKPANWKKGTSG